MATQGYSRPPYSPTRFPAGITNANAGEVTQNLGKPDETKFFTDFDDFTTYAAGDWSLTGTPTVALGAGVGGWLSVTRAAAAAIVRRNQSTFQVTVGKQMFFKFRLSLADVANSVVWFGLMNSGATPANATDGIYFNKADTESAFTANVRVNATTGAYASGAIGSILDATPTTLGFWYDGKHTVRFYQDDQLIQTVDITAYFPDTALVLGFSINDGTGGSGEVMLVDYVYCAQER